jgi:hypothetical protein
LRRIKLFPSIGVVILMIREEVESLWTCCGCGGEWVVERRPHSGGGEVTSHNEKRRSWGRKRIPVDWDNYPDHPNRISANSGTIADVKGWVVDGRNGELGGRALEPWLIWTTTLCEGKNEIDNLSDGVVRRDHVRDLDSTDDSQGEAT